MRKKTRKWAVLILLLAAGCFPAVNVTMVDRSSVVENTKTPTKAHILDGSVLLYPEGCVSDGATLHGIGSRHWIDHEDAKLRPRSISLDSVAAVTYYDESYSAGRALAQGMFGIFAPIMTSLGVYCATNPKACFGSCPTVYTYSTSGPVLEAELFSSSVSRQMEASDLDILGAPLESNGSFALRVTNEAMETHYINRFQLVSAIHPEGTHVYPGPDSSLIVVGTLQSPKSARNRSGVNVAQELNQSDGEYYRTSSDDFDKLMDKRDYDWIDLTTDVPEGVSSVKLVLKMRNSLLSTVLFYDLVLGSQGLGAITWTEQLDNDPVYSALFEEVYHQFSGVKVLTVSGESTTLQASVTDVGPINWKRVAIEIPAGNSGPLTVRLQFFPDNIFIDYVGFDVSGQSHGLAVERPLHPSTIIDNEGTVRSDILPFISIADDRYLVTKPGDSYRLFYDIPSEPPGTQQTLFVRSQGYYTEWIRGGWLIAEDSNYSFDLFDTRATLAELKMRWIRGRDSIEDIFFNARVPVREEK